MSTELTPRIKRLLLATPFLCIVVMIVAPMLNSQRRHLIAVRDHIARIAPQWKDFRATHPGFQEVKLFDYTGGDGMFGANGFVPTDEELAQLRRFMESTMPPRPIYLDSVHVVGKADFDIMFGDKGKQSDQGSNRPPAPHASIR